MGDILVSACPYVCMYVCVYSCSRYCLETSCMDSSWKNSRRIFLAFPLSNYGPLTNKGMKFCKCRISKSIIARNFKLVMLMGMMIREVFGEILEKNFFNNF